MKNLDTILSRHACVYMLLSFLLFPLLLQAQKKQSTVIPAASPDAIYNAQDAGKYMRKWWLLGPIPVTKDSTKDVDMASQIKFFDQDPLYISELHAAKKPSSVSVDGKGLAWSLYASKKDMIDLDSLFKRDLAVVYASSEVIADSSYQAFLAVGSDDGVKVWHNKKLVHKNWTPRGVVPDQDIIAIPLEKGINHILIAVQDIHQGWGFTARFLDKAALSERLVAESARGNLDDINLLLKAGADVNKRNPSGIMALDAARLNGRDEVVKLLLQNGARDQAMPAPEKLVDALYSSLTTKNAPGVAVLISQDGKIVYKKAFGYADLEKKERVSTDTKFRIGSITKQFTAASILKLQEENRLSVTDKLSKYFPDFPRAEEVTLHHLLTHTSGIHSYTGKSDFIQKVIKPITNEELLAYFKNDPYDFNPGEQYRYNNSGYFLLGYIIEKVSGKSYSKYLKDTFFDPLQMKNTGVYTTTLTLKNEAKGHMKSGTKYDRAPNWDMSWAGGAGALYSTVDDLYTWSEALFNGKVLNEKSLVAALTPAKLNNGKTSPEGEYGYGLGMRKYREHSVVEHGGGLHGFISLLSRFPDDNLTVAILTNISPPEIEMNSNTVAQYYLWEKMAAQPSNSVQSFGSQDLKAFEGRYDFKNGAVMIVTSEGDALFAQLTGQPKFPIFPSAPGEFFWKVVDAKIKFLRNENGEVTGGHFAQAGNEMDVPKMKEEVIVSVDPAIYKKYAGKYDYGNNFHITITTENNKIFAQGTNQPKFEILPLSEKEYTLREVNARILFVEGPDGRANKLNLDMAGQKKDAPRIE